MMEASLALLFGLLIGSFLNVCIYRWPRDLSVVRPRSHCPSCNQTIPWYDNIPLLSYALLGGRCRHCRGRIGIRYPVVELLTGLCFSYFAWTLGPTIPGLKMCVFAALLTALLFCDLEERILPDELTLGGALAGLAFALFVPPPDSTAETLSMIFGWNLTGRAGWLAESVLGALLPAAFLWVGGWLYEKVRQRQGLGFGDVKFMVMVGSFLGLNGALLSLLLGSLGGAVLGYAWLLIARKDPRTYELPFGTFLSAAALVVGMAAPNYSRIFFFLRS